MSFGLYVGLQEYVCAGGAKVILSHWAEEATRGRADVMLDDSKELGFIVFYFVRCDHGIVIVF